MSEQPNLLTSNKDWTKEILDWYAQGDFDVEVASKLKVPLKEFHTQMQENAAFGRLVQYGRTLCEAFWVHQAKKNMNNKTFNATSWAFVMKNQFNWADKSEQMSAGDSGNVNLDELRERLNKQVNSFLKQHQPEMTEAQAALRVVQSE